MKWLKILCTTQLPLKGSIKTVKLESRQICIINDDDQFYATQAYCPHAGGHFDGGWCKKGSLVCPVHRYEYDLHTGRGAAGQGDYIHIYPVELREDGLYVGFKESWWTRLWN